MAEAATAGGGSLSGEFNWWSGFMKAMHWSHILMIGGILVSSLAAVSTSGASVGLVDVALKTATGFWDMVVGGYSHILDAWDGASSVADMALNGDWYTGVDIPGGMDMAGMDSGAMAGMAGHHAAGADMVGHCTKDAFNSTMSGMSVEDFQFNQELAAESNNDFVGQVEGLCHGMQ